MKAGEDKKYIQFTASTNSLRKLRTNSSPNIKRERICAEFNQMITDLYQLKQKVYPVRKEVLTKLAKQKRNMIRLSSFSLMEHDFVENTHSNILEYIFDYKLIGETGAKILSDFVLGIENGNNKTISNLILKNSYMVERESFFDKGRMDLFIYDHITRFVIIIENKIFASVSKKEELITGDNDSIVKTQLNNYIDFIQKNYPSYLSLYILLSYRRIENKKYLPFIHLDYEYLYDIISKYQIKDNILSEYKLLLYILNNNLQPSVKLFLRQLRDLIKNRKIKLDLNSIEQMKVLLNGIK